MTIARPLTIAVLLVAAMRFPGCSAQAPRRTEDLVLWSEGPVRWLMLAEERRQIDNVRSAMEAGIFIDIFWTRRDPDPSLPGNAFLRRFRRRVYEADQLYTEGGVTGSLTDRGGAVILFGSPSRIKVTSRPALSWDPTSGDPHETSTHDIKVEIWSYAAAELPPGMLDRFGERSHEREEGITLTFTTVGGRTVLSEGAQYLRVAARAAVGIDPPRSR